MKLDDVIDEVRHGRLSNTKAKLLIKSMVTELIDPYSEAASKTLAVNNTYSVLWQLKKDIDEL